MHIDRRQSLRWLAASLAAPGLSRAQSGAALPPAVRIAGGATHVDGKLVLGSYANIIAKEGWLESQLAARNVKLEWFATAHSATGPMINEGFANGSVDFANYGDLPSAILNAGGVQTRLVVANGLGDGDGFLVVPKNSTARSIEDLKGKTLAVHRGRPWELPLLRLLKSKGLQYSDFKLYNINPQAGMSAIASGHVDALFTMTDAYLLEDRGLARILWSTREAPLDWKTRTDFWAAKSFIDKYPELTQLVVTAYVRAAHWASQEGNRDVLVRNATLTGTPESVVRRTYSTHQYAWKDRWSPLFNDVVVEHFRKTVQFALDQKLIARPVPVDTWIDRRFVPVALAQLKLDDYWQRIPLEASGFAPAATRTRS